jgi:hypothetical protein
MRRILAIVGSRSYHDYQQFCKMMDYLIKTYDILNDVDEVVSGGAPGVDTLAERWTKERNSNIKLEFLKFTAFNADWSLGKRAGPIRNQKIVDKMTHMVALPSSGSTGTRDSIRKAAKAGKTCYIIEI